MSYLFIYSHGVLAIRRRGWVGGGGNVIRGERKRQQNNKRLSILQKLNQIFQATKILGTLFCFHRHLHRNNMINKWHTVENFAQKKCSSTTMKEARVYVLGSLHYKFDVLLSYTTGAFFAFTKHTDTHTWRRRETIFFSISVSQKWNYWLNFFDLFSCCYRKWA